MSRAPNIAAGLVLLAWSVLTQPIRYSSADSTPPPNVAPLGLAWVYATAPITAGYAPNCDGSYAHPALNILDFSCFINRFAFRAYVYPQIPVRNEWADCDQSGLVDVLDFSCYVNAFASGHPPPISAQQGTVTLEHTTLRGMEIVAPAFDSRGASRHTLHLMASLGPVELVADAPYLDITECWHVVPVNPGEPDVVYLPRRLSR